MSGNIKNLLRFLAWSAACLSCFVILSCGNAGDSSKNGKLGFDGDTSNIKGAISTSSGSQAEMQGWVIALVDRATGISRVAEIDVSGLFTFRSVPVSGTYTLVLVSPDYILSGVLSIGSTIQNTVYQFFKLRSSTLPKIVQNGSIITFQAFDTVTVVRDLASDSDGDGVPDGIQGLSLTGDMPFKLNNDIDGDRIPNNEDRDIDGDGVINEFDHDDDGDAIIDVVDPDANGDLVADFSQQETDAYFPQGIEWASVTHEIIPQDDGTTKRTLHFVTKLNENYAAPLGVYVRGSPTMLNSAIVEYTDQESGETSSQAFIDRALFDDALNSDGLANDYIFARKITLDSSVKPRSQQVIFFQLAYGDIKDPYFVEFPYLFPKVDIKTITAKFDATSRIVSLSGNPFGAVQDYFWSVNIYDADGARVAETQPLIGSQAKTQVIPENVYEADGGYSYRVVAKLQDRVPGYTSYRVSSELKPLE